MSLAGNDPAFTKYRSQQKLSSDESEWDEHSRQLRLRTEQNTKHNQNIQALSLATARVSHPVYSMIPSPHKNMYIQKVGKMSESRDKSKDNRPTLSPGKLLPRSGQKGEVRQGSSRLNIDKEEQQLEDFLLPSNKRGPAALSGQQTMGQCSRPIDHSIIVNNSRHESISDDSGHRILDPSLLSDNPFSGKHISRDEGNEKSSVSRDNEGFVHRQHNLLGVASEYSQMAFDNNRTCPPSSQVNGRLNDTVRYGHRDERPHPVVDLDDNDCPTSIDFLASLLTQQRLTNDAIQGLAHAMKGSLAGQTRPSSNIFLPGVSNFNGDINTCATSFLKELNEAFTLDRIPSDFRMCLLKKKLRGEALAWFEALIDREGDLAYEVFCQKFLQTFGRLKRDKRENHLSRFINMKREEGESYSKFIAKLKLEAYLGQVEDDALIVNVALSHLPAEISFPLKVAGMTKSITQIESMLKCYDDSAKQKIKSKDRGQQKPQHQSHNQPQQSSYPLSQPHYPPAQFFYSPPPMQGNKPPQFSQQPPHFHPQNAPQQPQPAPRRNVGDRFFNVPHGDLCEDPEARNCRTWVNIVEMGGRFCSTCGFQANDVSAFRSHLPCSAGGGCEYCASQFHTTAACFKLKREQQYKRPPAGPSD